MKSTVRVLSLGWLAGLVAGACEVTVETSQGLVIGERTSLPQAGSGSHEVEVQLFKGIPYSQPPLGEHRWKPPREPAPFEKGWYRADRWPDSCPNKVGSPNPFCRTCSTRSNPPIEPNSEDCLRLNVMAPAAATPASKLAVMVYVHGGGGTIGSGRMYTQSAGLVHKDVILVTINYRLGILGFLAHPLLTAEQGGVSGNYQVLDMIAALDYVKTEIVHYGGDPDRITVFGQSFGGSAMHYLMLAPAAGTVYDAVISQSGGGIGNYSTLDDAEATTGAQLFRAIGCETLECARAKPWTDVVDSGVGRSQPIVHPRGAIPLQPLEALRSGRFNKKPAVFGSNIVENHLNDYFTTNPYSSFVSTYSSDEYFKSTVTSLLQSGCTTPECQREYPSTEAGVARAMSLYPEGEALPNNYERYSEARVDATSGMSTFQWAQEYGASPDAKAWRYVFAQKAEGSATLGPFGCGHLVENLYAFSDPEIIGPGHVFAKGERDAADATTTTWARFAKELTMAPEWPAFTADTPATQLFGPDGDARAVTNWRDSEYRFFSLWLGYCGPVYPCTTATAKVADA